MKDVARVPRQLRLDGWVGPTLFTSEIRDGKLVTLATFRAALADHHHAKSLVLGTERETHGAATAHAAFCIEPRTEEAVWVDLDPPAVTRFVNSSVAQLLDSFSALVAAWPRLTGADDAAGAVWREAMLHELGAIDAAAVSNADAFWPTALESYTL